MTIPLTIPPWYRPILTLPPADVIRKKQLEREAQYKNVFKQIVSDAEFLQNIIDGSSSVYKFSDETNLNDVDRIFVLHQMMVTNVSIAVTYTYNLGMAFYQDIPDELLFNLSNYIEYAEKPEDQYLKEQYAKEPFFTVCLEERKWILSDLYREICEVTLECAIRLAQLIPTKIP